MGLHPSGLAATPDGRLVCVANANSDTVSVIDAAAQTKSSKRSAPGRTKNFFSAARQRLGVSADGRTLYVANGANNAVAVVRWSRREPLVGLLPHRLVSGRPDAGRPPRKPLRGQRQGNGLTERRAVRAGQN